MNRRHKVAVIHYHLRPGGVTRVIENTTRVLNARGFTLCVLSGESCGNSEIPRTAVVSGLGYDERVNGNALELLRELRVAAETVLGGAPDLWHFHNHSLGKNARVSALPGMLAAEGDKVLLQIHDFAENGRPRNQPLIADMENLYPQGGGVRYVVLSERDRSVLCDAGLPAGQVRVVPNPVSAPVRSGSAPSDDNARKLLFYPTRAIRRKNIGEAILFSLALPGNWCLATSRAPENPQWLEIYRYWESVVGELDCPLAMAVVDRMSPQDLKVGDDVSKGFAAWYGVASAILTTSVSEGFGMSFLEPLLAGLPVIGRDLPALTSETGKHGIRHEHLYRGIQVPLEWLGEEHFKIQLERRIGEWYAAYRRAPPEDAVREAFNAMVDQGKIDFGNLLESDQTVVIRKVADAPENLARIRVQTRDGTTDETLPEWLGRHLAPDLGDQSDVVEKAYGLEGFGEKMARCYVDLLGESAQPAKSEPDVAEAILRRFLHPRGFHFLLR